MERTVRILRIALPAAFVLFVIVIALSWTRTRRTHDRNEAEPVVPTRTGERPQVEARTFEDTQTVGGKIVSRIRATRVIAYSSNWNTLEDVQLTIFRPNGLAYELSCPHAQFNSKTKEADAKGGVRVTSTDNLVISTAEIHYDGTRLTNHIPVQFTVDRWNGTAGALDLDVPAETLRLFEKLDATMTPAHPGEAPMRLRSSEGLFRRKENDVTFTSFVELTRQADVLTGDRMVGQFAQDRRTLVGLNGEGHIVIVMSASPAAGENLGGRKQINCDRFTSEVSATGEINAINAIGDASPAHAILDGPPKRDIVAKTFRVALAKRAVTELRAEPQVVMKELADPPRQITADHVTVGFDPAAHKASSAFLEGNVRYSDPRNQASAVRANYDIAADSVVLSAEPGFDPTVTTDGNVLRAKQIEFSPHAGTARATGSVIAELISKPGSTTSADQTSVFPANKPVFVNSDLLVMRQANKVGVFTGHVRAWQDTNTVLAQEMQVEGTGDTITARGGVHAVLYNVSNTDPTKKTRVTSVSEQLFARKAERKIDLTGSVKIDDDQRSLTGDHASIFFDASRKIERIEAEKNVVLIDRTTQRKGTGDKAIYLLATRMITVTGNPATVTDPTQKMSAPKFDIDLAHNRVEVSGQPGAPTKGTYKTKDQ